MKRRIIVGVVLSGYLAGVGVGGAEAADGKGAEFFERRVRPMLVEHCYKCHSSGAEKIKGGLVLDSQEGWMNGGESGEAIIPGRPEASLLIKAISYKDPDLQMPPKYQLGEAEIQTLTEWVKMGAPDPRTGMAKPEPQSSIDIGAGKAFWAFRPVQRAAVPEVKDGNWPEVDLDRFVLAKLEEKGLKPVEDASRRQWIRRVSFDLTGLPPRPEEIEKFLADARGDEEASEEVVNRLLGSAQFGERWGRHWLDVVRYAESMGRTRNWPFPFAWRYRDYVINAFNQDKPYDRFLIEQLAGDLLPAESVEEKNENWVATGFLALGAQDLNERNVAKFTMDAVDEQIDVTARAFLGVTAGCARCHDHKFDPIPTTDYYALAGIFKSTEVRSGYGVRGRGGNKDYFKAESLNLLAGLEAGSSLGPAVAPAKPDKQVENRRKRLERQLLEWNAELKELNQSGGAKAKGAKAKRAESRKRAGELKREIKKVRNQLAQLEVQVPLAGNLAMGVREGRSPGDCKVNVRGDAQNLGASVPRGFLRVLCAETPPSIPAGSSGRLELARWMTSERHPLTARVMVNRIWHHLFGRGLVGTVDNFGETGERPTHPELLDHLATRFMETGWSVKGMIREIVLSRSYRMSSRHEEENYAVDPDNVFLWRMSVRRLEVEAVRDALLAVSGQLDLAPVEGSPVMNLRMAEVGRRGLRPADESSNHRAVYMPVIRNLLPDMFEAFDFAEPSSVIGRRDVTTVSTQALFMMNNPLVLEQSGHLADLLVRRAPSDEGERIRVAYERALGREPNEAEKRRGLEYVKEVLGSRGGREREAWQGLCQALFASAEFRYLQ